MKYVSPELELKILMANDVIAASTEGDKSPVVEGGGVVTPDDEL